MKAGEVVLFRNDGDVDYGVIKTIESIAGIDNVWSYWSDYSSLLKSPVVHLTVIAPRIIGEWQ